MNVATPRVLLGLLVSAIAALVPQAVGEQVPPENFNAHGDLEVTSWATTPMFYNPTNMDIDAQGRIWVTEAVNYRNFNDPNINVSHPKGDRVVWLKDTNGDGKADRSQVFVQDEDLVAPLGIGVIGNEIYVSSSPHLIRYTDVNRNGKFEPDIDKKEKWLTGFGGKDHDHGLHALTAGPDGWFYFTAGNAGPHIVTDHAGWTLRAGSSYNGGTPYMGDNRGGMVSDDGRMWVGGVALRIRPDGTGMRPIGHNFRNAYEHTLSSFGNVFQNDNDDPPACRTTWLMRYGNLGFASANGKFTWQACRRPGQSVATAEWRQENPGTIPAGDVYGHGAPTGIVHYENGALGKKYRGLLLSAESARSEIFGYFPDRQGAGFKLERFKFLSVDGNRANWFRPSDVAVGPDGAIYVADWYDPGVGGHGMDDKTASGTIYRIAPEDFEPSVPEFDLSTTEGQIEALSSPAVNVRYLGFRALADQGEKAVDALWRMWQQTENRYVAARAVWLLARTDSGAKRVYDLLTSHDSARTRVLAFRALERAGHKPLKLARRVVDDPSSAVRRTALLALRDTPYKKKRKLLIEMAGDFNGKDRWYLEAIGTAAEGKRAKLYKALVKRYGSGSPVAWDARMAKFAWRLHPKQSVDALRQRAMARLLSQDKRQAALDALAFVDTRQAAEALVEVAREGPADLRNYAIWWGKHRTNHMWQRFSDYLNAELPEKKEGESDKPKITFRGRPVYTSEVATGKKVVDINADIQGANKVHLIVDDAGDGYHHDWADWINPRFIGPNGTTPATKMDWESAAAGWGEVRINNDADGSSFNPAGKSGLNGIGTHARSIITYDVSDKKFTRFVARGAIDGNKTDSPGSVRFSVYVSGKPPAKTVGDLPSPEKIAKLKGNAKRGRKLFTGRGTCFSCHKVNDIGNEIGPDLTGIADRFAPRVVAASIVNPSASVAFGYETYTVTTKDGDTHTGFLVADGDPMVLADVSGNEYRIPRDRIADTEKNNASIMPAAATLGLKGQDVADLIAFLKNPVNTKKDEN